MYVHVEVYIYICVRVTGDADLGMYARTCITAFPAGPSQYTKVSEVGCYSQRQYRALSFDSLLS